ncbi:YCF48-related protein [Pseudomonas sp. FME51]|uniref:YCF48-related protein n=1 Tax=Pseudomonas sp. FME51 TaxID=2742609 RepID=UPI0018680891|nr:YCF48-related protein [Pseudomonas sp. FME51]
MSLHLFSAVLQVAVIALVCTLATAADIDRPEVLDRPVVKVDQPAKAFLQKVTRAGERLVAVGEGGIIILSDDDGGVWRQAEAPASVLLTDVAFADAQHGWAIGHLGVILRTEDGGESWVHQLDGIEAAQLVLEHARQRTAQEDSDDNARAVRMAEFLVEDGPDKPFLTLHVMSSRQALVLGAFGYAVLTMDGGQNWAPVSDNFENPMGMHYYDIAIDGADRVVVGERGMVLKYSPDKGYQAVEQPYEGTLFGVVSVGNGIFVAYGLRGNAIRSTDAGSTWALLDTGVTASLQAGTRLPDGSLLLAAENGQLILSRDNGASFQPQAARSQPTAGLLSLSDKSVLSVGPYGPQLITLADRK